MDESKEEILSRYTRRQYPPLPAKPKEPVPVTALRPEGHYQALESLPSRKDRAPRYEIAMRGGKSTVIGFFNTGPVYMEGPDMLAIETGHGMYYLSGRGLNGIKNAFLDETVRVLTEFDERVHTEPDEDEPKIISLEFKRHGEHDA